MPLRDGTGPNGAGPKTGYGLGQCDELPMRNSQFENTFEHNVNVTFDNIFNTGFNERNMNPNGQTTENK